MKRPIVISVAGPKGGSGKTTIAINLASALRLDGCSVLLVDTDPLKTAGMWGYFRFATLIDGPHDPVTAADGESRFPVVTVEGGDLSVVTDPDLKFDFVIVDSSARSDSDLMVVLTVSDIVVIPVRPSPLDIWSNAGFVAQIHRVRESCGDRPIVAFLPSVVNAHSRLSKNIDRALKPYGLPVLETRVFQRVSYERTLNRGVSVLHVDNDQAAAEEIRNLASEIRTMAEAIESVAQAA